MVYRTLGKTAFSVRGCGTCLEQCPSAPDVPTIMRSYMYAYGYRDLPAAARNLDSIKDNPISCADCSYRTGFHLLTTAARQPAFNR